MMNDEENINGESPVIEPEVSESPSVESSGDESQTVDTDSVESSMDESTAVEPKIEEITEEVFEPQDIEDIEEGDIIAIESLIKEERDLERVAQRILEGTFRSIDILRKDSIERFLDFVILKVRTGISYIPSLAFPTKRIADEELERKVIELLNNHLYPDIILVILKYFTRNIHDSDTNLYLAYLITSDEIIGSVFNTFQLFKKDIFELDEKKRSLNVKRIQQFSPRTDNRFSSPLDTACRFKYILEFIAYKQNVEHIYTKEMISLSGKIDI